MYEVLRAALSQSNPPLGHVLHSFTEWPLFLAHNPPFRPITNGLQRQKFVSVTNTRSSTHHSQCLFCSHPPEQNTTVHHLLITGRHLTTVLVCQVCVSFSCLCLIQKADSLHPHAFGCGGGGFRCVWIVTCSQDTCVSKIPSTLSAALEYTPCMRLTTIPPSTSSPLY